MKQIDLKEFFKNAPRNNFQISPDYKSIAFLETYKKRKNIFVMDLKTKKIRIITKQQKRNIDNYGWKTPKILYYLHDQNGDENYHLLLVNLATLKVKDLTPGKKIKVSYVDDLVDRVYLLGQKQWLDKMIVMHNQRDSGVFDHYLFDIKTGHQKLLLKMQLGEYNQQIYYDENLLPKYTYKSIQGFTEYYKISPSGKRKKILKVSSKDHFEIIGETPFKNKLYVTSNIGYDKIGFFYANLNLKQTKKPLFIDADVDINQICINKQNKQLSYLTLIKEKYQFHYFDKKLEQFHNQICQSLRKKFVWEKDSNIFIDLIYHQEKIIMIKTINDKKREGEYLYFIETKEFLRLTKNSQLINPDYLVDMQPIEYRARDGLLIRGYLTLPKEAKLPIAIIVNPHGGPWVREVWGYNPVVQFFANRGFGFLQMNFRISTGYGKKFFLKGWKEWGKKCQDDITDGTKWLIKKGYTTKGKIALFGASYGGYATLMGIVKEPKLYSAAVDYCGISDLFVFWDSFPPYWKFPGNIFEEAMGNPYKNKQGAKEVSPIYHIDKIITPLMVVQGTNDPRVPQKQSDLIVEKLKKHNVYVEYLLKKDEGHGFSNQENRFEMYQKMLAFFNKFLK